MAAIDPERTKQLFKEGGKAFALPAGVMGGIITTRNDLQTQLANAHVDIKRVQQQNGRLRSRLANNTATSAECKAAIESAKVCSDVYGQCLTEYTQMAENAQRNNAAGVISVRRRMILLLRQ